MSISTDQQVAHDTSVPQNSTEKNKNNGELEEKELKRQAQRRKCVQEIIDTEQTYCDQLIVLTKLYVEPLKTNGILKEGQHAILFPDIQVISGLNSNLLETLKRKLQCWDNAKSTIGDDFMEFTPFFKIYQRYVNNHEKATKVLEELDSSDKFQRFCNQQQMNQQSKGLSLGSFLILPIQRVPRYELCFRELLKLTNKDHPDYEDIEKTLKQIAVVNATINTRMKDFSSQEQVREVEQKFGRSVSLVFPSRRYIREGYLMKVCRNKDRKYLFLLFNDLLLYCSKNAEKYSLHQKIPLDHHFRIEDIQNNRKYGSLCFEIHSTVKSFLVFANDLNEKNAWVHDIRECLNKLSTVFEIARASDDKKTTAPVWFPDEFSEKCMNKQCEKIFSWKRRRHHCRYCGSLICADCSSTKLPNRNNEQEIVRVCAQCFQQNKDKFPDLEERLKLKKWFPGHKRSSTQDEEDGWDEESDNSDGEKGNPSPKTNDSPLSMKGASGMIVSSIVSPKTLNPTHQLSERHHSSNSCNSLSQQQLSGLGIVTKTSSERIVNSLSTSDDESNTSEFKLDLPTDIDANLRGIIVEMQQKYLSKIEHLQTTLNKEREKNSDYEKQMKDLREQTTNLQAKILSLTSDGGKSGK